MASDTLQRARDNDRTVVEQRAIDENQQRITADQWQSLLGVLHLRVKREEGL